MVRPPSRNPGSVNQRHARAANMEGWEKKNGSIQRLRAAISQPPMNTTRIKTCNTTAAPRLLLFICRHDLLFEAAPDGFIDFRESRNESSFGDVAGTRQADGIIGFDSRVRTCGQEQNAIGHRNRLLE